MNNWNGGYVSSIDYTYGFYRELTPSLMAFANLCQAKRFDLSRPGMTYCELGCGQGFSTNLLAAANPDIEFYANDFLPDHVAGANDLKENAKLTNVHFYEHAFADFIAEPSLPEAFDIISLHGVYSWISSENRQAVVDFIAKKLRPGGLVFISYNTLPGWSTAMPLRRILVDKAQATTGPLESRISAALDFATHVMGLDSGYFKHVPSLSDRLSKMKEMPANYLAHEYFNEDWTPFYFQDVAGELSAAKLSYIGPINLLEHLEPLLLPRRQKDVLAQEPDPLRREALRDVLLNEQFRRDLFGKGSLPLTFRSAAAIWLDTRFIAMSTEKGPIRIRSSGGMLELDDASYQPLFNVFSDGPLSVRDILTSGVLSSQNWEQLTRGFQILVGAGRLQPCLSVNDEDKRLESCMRFNRTVCARAEESDMLQFLASPVTGGGVAVDRFEQLFLTAISQGKDVGEWAAALWKILGPQGYKLLKNGQTLETAEENLSELNARAIEFAHTRLPVLRHLRVHV